MRRSRLFLISAFAFVPMLLFSADVTKMQDSLMRSIEKLIPEGVSKCRAQIKFVRTDRTVEVTLTQNCHDYTGTVTQAFRMPDDCTKAGDCVFRTAQGAMADGIVEFHGPHGVNNYYNLGPYSKETAQEIVNKLNKLKESLQAGHDTSK